MFLSKRVKWFGFSFISDLFKGLGRNSKQVGKGWRGVGNRSWTQHYQRFDSITENVQEGKGLAGFEEG